LVRRTVKNAIIDLNSVMAAFDCVTKFVSCATQRRQLMHRTIKIAVVALALVGGSLVVGSPAMADNVTIGISPGGFAFGYTDGYWDRDHNWHGWQNREEAERFRAENRDHYYDRKHDEERNEGWRENEQWWEHH
jgi:hypothetical protein